MLKHHLILAVGAFAVGYLMSNTLSGYQPFKWAATAGANLA